MSPVQFARDVLKKKAYMLFDEYRAMVVFLARMNSVVSGHLRSQRLAIEHADKSELKAAVRELQSHIDDLRTAYGATQSIGKYAELLAATNHSVGTITLVPVYMAVGLFSKYPGLLEAVEKDEIPVHARIEIDHDGKFPPREVYEYYIQEAMLFEDMCIFWNESCSIHSSTADPWLAKRSNKRLHALHRAAVSSAFYMVEAYCNGIALAAFISRHKQLKQKEIDMLTEHDSARSRPRHLSIRETILHYPRLLAGVEHPLIQESNSPDLDYFLSSAKDLRDSIVHANPAPSMHLDDLDKSATFFQLSHEQCAKVIDSSISVIRQIADATKTTKSVFWIASRRPDGLFEDSVLN
jgi:hypothetical protein